MNAQHRRILRKHTIGWAQVAVFALLALSLLELLDWLRDRRPVHTHMRTVAIERDVNRIEATLIADKRRSCAFVTASATAYAFQMGRDPVRIPMVDIQGHIGGVPMIGAGKDQEVGRFVWDVSAAPHAEHIRFHFAHDCGAQIINDWWPAFKVPEDSNALDR